MAKNLNPTRFERMTLRISQTDWNLTRYRCAKGSCSKT